MCYCIGMANAQNNNSNGRKPLTKKHLDALAEGRVHGRIVREYLEALDAHRPRRGRKRTPESVQHRLETVEKHLIDASPFERVGLLQERIDLLKLREGLEEDDNLQELEDAFVEVAADWGGRKGITFAAWREVGVPPEVLKRAGIQRTTVAAA